MNARIGWTFAAAMRTFLRADPDVIMIGEMRDEETARIAIEASLTGHLVMSTLHTNSAPESVTRLLEIGLDPFMFSDSLLAVLAQRLVRRLCTDCRVAEPLDDRALRSLLRLYQQSGGGVAADEETIRARWLQRHGVDGSLRQYRRCGCDACKGSGYRGRLGIHELLVADESLREGVRRRAPATDLFALAQRSGMRTLRQDGIEKLLAGLTDLPEVLAATNQ
jgi:type II secretory ATPase GspE/PulE/Tfp pilus assembly ATPase PilB-like protein